MNDIIRRPSELPAFFADVFSNNDLFFNRMREELESVMQTIWPDTGQLLKGASREYPRMDIWEDEKAFHLEAAVPGWKKEEVKLLIDNGVLTLTGTKEVKEEVVDKDRKYIERKVAHRNFQRAFKLPENLDLTKVDADMQDGILHVILSKAEPDQPRVIEVQIK